MSRRQLGEQQRAKEPDRSAERPGHEAQRNSLPPVPTEGQAEVD